MTAVAKSGPEMAPGLPSVHPSHDWRVLSAGRGRPARRPFGFLVWRCLSSCQRRARRQGHKGFRDVCRLSLVDPRICWQVGGMRDIPVEALFPQGRERLELASSGWSRVLRIDAVGGPSTAISP